MKKLENADESVAEYDRLEAEGTALAAVITKAGRSVPIRPVETKFSGAMSAYGSFDPKNVVLSLRDYIGELRALAGHKSATPRPVSGRTHRADATDTEQPAAEAATVTSPATVTAVTSLAATEASAAKPKTATEALLAERGVKTLAELKAPPMKWGNPSLPQSAGRLAAQAAERIKGVKITPASVAQASQ